MKEYTPRNVVISQSVSNPVGDETNTDCGNPAAMQVPENQSKSLFQNVGHPSVMHPSRGKNRPQ